jgi:hypothetical protein
MAIISVECKGGDVMKIIDFTYEEIAAGKHTRHMSFSGDKIGSLVEYESGKVDIFIDEDGDGADFKSMDEFFRNLITRWLEAEGKLEDYDE